MDNFGKKIRQLRQEKGLPLQTIASYLDVEQEILRQIESGKLIAKREQVEKLAKYFQINDLDLIIVWLSDKVVYEDKNEKVTLKSVAEKPVRYFNHTKDKKKPVIQTIKDFFIKDGRIAEAWLFGSFVRGDDTNNSDIDLAVNFVAGQKISLFDLADIAFQLGKKINRKIDLVEKDCIKPLILETAKRDLIKIYG